MKKKLFAAIVAFVATMNISTAALAVDPGSTNGTAQTDVTVEADKPVEFTTDTGVAVEAAAGVFPAGEKVTMETEVKAVEKEAVATTETAVAAAVGNLLNTEATDADAAVVVNTKISITFKSGETVVQPNGKVKVTVAADADSNYAAYVGDDGTVELFKLTKSDDGKFVSFETSHFSDYYFVKVSEKAASAIGDGKSVKADDTKPGNSEEPGNSEGSNPPTGVAVAVVPVGLAAAFGAVAAIVAKKKKG